MSDSKESADDMAPEPVTEVWLFAGNRVNGKGTKVHAWIPLPDNGDELWYKATGSPVPGNEYNVQVVRSGKRVTRYGTPTYHGEHDNAGRRVELEALHRAANSRLRLASLERNAARSGELAALLEPLEALMRKLPGPDREPVLTHIMTRLSRAW